MVVDLARPLAVAAAALAFFAAAEAGYAGTSTVPDADDVVGPLDIKSVSQGHSGAKVVHTIRTFATWRVGVLAPSTPNYFLLELSTDADAAPERSVLVFSRAGHMVGAIFGANGRFLAQAGVFHPNGRTVRVTIPRRRLGNPAAYRWQAFAFFRGATVCRTGCLDRAPNGSVRILHDLRKPTIAFPQPGAPAGPEYDVGFSLSDTGGSGIAGWRLEHRLLGETAWTIVATGTTAGAQTYHEVSSPGNQDQFRVVAVDGHGNTATSPVRTVAVPVR
jgi:hypothetical protein